MTNTHSTERIGVYMCGALFEQSNFIFREQAIEDYGIDALIETKEDDTPTGKLIAVQIKSGDSFFKEVDGNSVVYRIDEKHRNYWINHSLPVIIALYSPTRNECIWEVVNQQTLSFCQKHWKILIPQNQAIKDSCFKLHEIAQNMSEYEHRHASLVFAKPWMVEARKHGTLTLEVEEWVNKTSGKGRFHLISAADSENPITLFDHTLFGFGTVPYDQVIQKMFPWARITVDKDYYEENMEFSDDTNWDQFNEPDWHISIPREIPETGIYPYCNSAGEVDHYRLLLTLNHIGAAFLTTEEFLESGNLYQIDHLS